MRSPRRRRLAVAVLVTTAAFVTGCSSQNRAQKPAVEITVVPAANSGGPEQVQTIEGRVNGAAPGQQLILYARNGNGTWFVQPFRSRPVTKIQADSTWKNSTHLGTEYAALLVNSWYTAASKTTTLPVAGGGVVAVTSVKGRPVAAIAPKSIRFSGYDWIVRSADDNRGGDLNSYDPANAWTDPKGYLHLQSRERNGKWACAEVRLTRSLGYGTYRFVIQDSAHLPPYAVLGMFTWDEARDDETRSEMDIELSQWGNPNSKNAQYVVQPYYVPENIVRFAVPPGPLTHVLHWAPGVGSFKTIRGDHSGPSAPSASKSVEEHVFKSDVPSPAAETVHIDLYDFYHSRSGPKIPAEAVIESFEYLP